MSAPAATRVFEIPELLENILLEVDGVIEEKDGWRSANRSRGLNQCVLPSYPDFRLADAPPPEHKSKVEKVTRAGNLTKRDHYERSTLR